MANLTSVGLTSGVPTSGTGTVSTIDELIAVGLPISAALPAGSNVIGAVNIASAQTIATVTTVGAVTQITDALPAGTNTIGKVDIDQTTPGTTNGVVVNNSSLAVTGSFWQTTQPVSLATNTPIIAAGSASIGTVGLNAGTNTVGQVNGNGSFVKVTPTVTSSSYTAGFIVGGILTFANALPASFNGVIQTVLITFKGSIQTGEYDLILFSASPSNGTYADHTAGTYNAADMALVVHAIAVETFFSDMGTSTIYMAMGLGAQVIGTSTSLYGLLYAKNGSTNNFASTSEVSISLGVLW